MATAAANEKASVNAATAERDAMTTMEAKNWDLPRAPYEAGNAPANGTWAPTNQTIKDWRSVYRSAAICVISISAIAAIMIFAGPRASCYCCCIIRQARCYMYLFLPIYLVISTAIRWDVFHFMY